MPRPLTKEERNEEYLRLVLSTPDRAEAYWQEMIELGATHLPSELEYG